MNLTSVGWQSISERIHLFATATLYIQRFRESIFLSVGRQFVYKIIIQNDLDKNLNKNVQNFTNRIGFDTMQKC